MTDDKSKGKFSAVFPYLGYLYQGIYALYLILRAENYDIKIIIEGLDDIVLSDNELTQIKYHIDEESLSRVGWVKRGYVLPTFHTFTHSVT